MSRSKMLCTALLAAILLAPDQAVAQAAEDRWQVTLTPYLWFPSMDGTLDFTNVGGSQSIDVSVDADTLIGDLNFAAMVTAEARKGKWVIATDIMYMDLEGDASAVRNVDFNPGPGPINVTTTQLNVDTDTEMQGTIWTLAGGYNAIAGPGGALDVIAGFRYFYIKVTTDWQLTAAVTSPVGTATFPASGSVTNSDDIWDGIVGVRGRLNIADKWFVPYYLDVGTGDSELTWQGSLGVGYGFKWGDLVFGYRYLYYEQDDKLISDLSLGGLALGANFRF